MNTGYDSVHWIGFFQQAIEGTFVDNPDDPNHPHGDLELPIRWLLAGVVDAVGEVAERRGDPQFDSFIRTYFALATILTTWSSRITHAKCYDPNRPLSVRYKSLSTHRRMLRVLAEAATDESLDADYFPSQLWNPPYGKGAWGGDFI